MRRSPFPGARALEVALFALAFLVSGLVVMALLWSGTGPYEELMKGPPPGPNCVRLFDNGGGQTCYPIPQLVEMHRRWAQYVTGGTDTPPAFEDVTFTDDEYSHMADVRRVFDVLKFLVPLSLFVIIVRLQRARARSSRDMWALIRGGAVAATVTIAVLGLLAAFAFEQMFLLFHYVFFPQGNFLFPPTSNLIRLYPDWYWEGVSLRVGLSFIAVGIALAIFAALRLRVAGRSAKPRAST